MTYYDVHPIEICHDPYRINGFYFAKVNIGVREGVWDKPSRTEKLEVILNGPGVNKAIKKVTKQLTTLGIHIDLYKKDFVPLNAQA